MQVRVQRRRRGKCIQRDAAPGQERLQTAVKSLALAVQRGKVAGRGGRQQGRKAERR